MYKKYSFLLYLTCIGVCVLLLVILAFVVLGQKAFTQLAFVFLLALIPGSTLFCIYTTIRAAFKRNPDNLYTIPPSLRHLLFPLSRFESGSNTQCQAELELSQFDARTPDKETPSHAQ